MIRPLMLVILAGCAVEPLDAIDQAVHGPDQLGQAWMRERAAFLGCTGTRIGPRHVLTALHCAPSVGEDVFFYHDDRSSISLRRLREAVQVRTRPGTSSTDLVDSTGRFSDLAILVLDADVPWGTAATLAWTYPGSGEVGVKVGAGFHEGDPNPLGELRYVLDETSWSSDDDGSFETEDLLLDDGDSGGPFYDSGRVLGVLYGDVGGEAKYTSVPEHLTWILEQIGWTWPHGPTQAGTLRVGPVLQVFFHTHRACQYACEMTAACDAYTYYPALRHCTLLDSVTGTGAGDPSAVVSAAK